MSAHDFFIAYPSPNGADAEELSWELQDLNCTVYLDQEQIKPGEDFSDRLGSALETASIVVVLVSSHSDNAFYQKEEIVRAIQQHRQSKGARAVVPVTLDDTPPPYGLAQLQDLNASRPGGLKRVARELAKLLPVQDTAGEDSTLGLSTDSYHHMGAALKLDRYPQQAAVVDEFAHKQHVVLLLHGPRHQNVQLFVERIQRHLSRLVGAHHAVYRVPFKLQQTTARNGADWLRHLRHALGATGSAADAIATAGRENSILLVLGLRPLDRLDEEQEEGLCELIAEKIPELLQQAKPRHPVRFLVAVDYESDDPGFVSPLATRLDRCALEAEQLGTFRYRQLPRVTLPSWEDVESYLNNLRPRPSAEAEHSIRREYERLTAASRLSYQALADMVDRMVGDA